MVDDADFDRVSQFKWTAMKVVNKFGVQYYAYRTVWSDWKAKKQERILLHRFILGAPKGQSVDHKNRNPLDCRRSNLRLATASQQTINRVRRNKSGYRGVFQLSGGKYMAFIVSGGKKRYLGSFTDPIDAATAYDRSAIQMHGEFAVLNFQNEIIHSPEAFA